MVEDCENDESEIVYSSDNQNTLNVNTIEDSESLVNTRKRTLRYDEHNIENSEKIQRVSKESVAANLG